MALFTPVGDAREIALITLRLVVEALAEGNTNLAAAILDQIQPESPDNKTATVSACIGVALEHFAEYEMPYLGTPPGTELAIPPRKLELLSQSYGAGTGECGLPTPRPWNGHPTRAIRLLPRLRRGG